MSCFSYFFFFQSLPWVIFLSSFQLPSFLPSFYPPLFFSPQFFCSSYLLLNPTITSTLSSSPFSLPIPPLKSMPLYLTLLSSQPLILALASQHGLPLWLLLPPGQGRYSYPEIQQNLYKIYINIYKTYKKHIQNMYKTYIRHIQNIYKIRNVDTYRNFF